MANNMTKYATVNETMWSEARIICWKNWIYLGQRFYLYHNLEHSEYSTYIYKNLDVKIYPDNHLELITEEPLNIQLYYLLRII